MTNISLRELNQRSGHIVRTVASTGQSVVITDRNRPIARVVPISSLDSPVEQLVAAGILSHTPAPYAQPSNTDYLPSKTDVVSLLDRDDRV
ncbi:TPA: type II toxin-antitoxin system prevent-host-death family antitoxin [Corynebacterium striatum]|uniref:type II toxin-antitoxin system Phd/YefM family antitoxin n=1 Tax=Corynebacterium sp. HMSC06D04 TaxID=1581123 RepID=UPI0009F49BB7|nr:type II toxin-antitoxin system Phd/YefM family antitoxin [Corynebacterium sp. HMSC06D04]HBC8576008.1 type II toxin-antitoxin system prevent-host-death family antitoxin [Corynebacterium striatum]